MLVYILAAALLVLYTLGSFSPQMAGRALADRLQHQFGPFRHLEARIETDPPIDALGGRVDALRMRADGFAIQGLPIETAAVDTGPFTINVGSLWLGKGPTLAKPVDATVSALVTEDGLNAFVHSAMITQRLHGIPAQISVLPGISVTQNIDVNPGRVRVLAGKVALDGTVSVGGALVPFSATVSPHLVSPTQVALDQVEATMFGSPIPPSMLARARQTFDLSRFQTPGSNFSVSAMSFEPGALRLSAAVAVTKLTNQ